MIFFRKQVWPIREILSTLMKVEGSLIQETTQIFIRDLYDHTIQVMDTIESFRDVLSGLQDLYLSTISNRMNEVMKVLTVIATIFIPLTFIVGVYGMNFDRTASSLSMPELSWPYGYLLVWLVMFTIAALLLAFFRRRRWI
ncbi:MAG: CorA family divalent cation transporter, partial [Gammaproteobacteria bacterium]|nr:CorA family divalent cation transporter [Gammaproteobacteria bacterium]